MKRASWSRARLAAGIAILAALGLWVCSDAFGGTTTRVSVASDGKQANMDSSSGVELPGAISADGRFVAFQTKAANLVAGDTNGETDIFVHDRQTGQTTRVSVASDGTLANSGSGNPWLTPDGRFVAFDSGASNLVAGDTNGAIDVFVHDRQTGQTTRASLRSDGGEGNNASSRPSISGDGRFVTFRSWATNLAGGSDTNGGSDAFLHDRQTGTTSWLSFGGDRGSSAPRLSADGRFVAFASAATNLVPKDTNNADDVFVYALQGGGIGRVSVTSGGVQVNGGSSYPSISADGRFVAFLSSATNLVAGDTNGVTDAFVRDCQTGQTTRVSVASDGTQANLTTRSTAISGDGRFVAFHSDANNLVAGDTNSDQDMFVHDRLTGETTRVNLTSAGVQSNEDAVHPSINGDGRFVAFDSRATGLVAGDTNVKMDVFVRDRGAIPPAVTSFAVNNGAASTTSQAVTLDNACTGGPTDYMASESADFSGAAWLAYSAAPSFTLSSGYGTKTVYFKVKSEAGESAAVSDEIDYGVVTVYPAVPTQCPKVATQCPAVATSCPPTSTNCPSVTTSCPPITTKCPSGTTWCPTITTLCPSITTRCPSVSTKCPPITTKCPPITTLCPPVATKCPPITTACPPITTKCPPATTLCPPVTTNCPPVTTACPPAATACPPITTLCPAITTQCPAATTTCPPTTTNCPAVNTQCPPVDTSCPACP